LYFLWVSQGKKGQGCGTKLIEGECKDQSADEPTPKTEEEPVTTPAGDQNIGTKMGIQAGDLTEGHGAQCISLKTASRPLTRFSNGENLTNILTPHHPGVQAHLEGGLQTPK